MIDTHAHLDFPQFDPDRDEIIRAGFDNGLETVINIGTDLESSRKSVALSGRFEHIYAAIGVHPHDSRNCPKDYLAQLQAMVEASNQKEHKVVAIGEIGLDYYRDMSPRDIQRRVFREQLDLARKLSLPVVVHIRESMDDSLKILDESGVRRGVLHSFPGNTVEALAGIDLGFHISFAGPITYPKSLRPAVAAGLPMRKILVETDSPYLTPQVYRGQRNQPDYVRYVINKLADIFAPYTFADIERITSLNARRLFGLPLDKTPQIVYKIRNSLYINLTNRCNCACYFCPRLARKDGYVAGHYLLLKSKPTSEQIVKAAEQERNFSEVVFCGLGEPTMRLKELLEVAAAMKTRGHRVRLDTNGHGSLINKTNAPAKLAGLVDKVSVSLNASDPETYIKLCKPDRGAEAYQAMIDFIRDSIRLGIAVEASVVDLPEVDIEACRQLAAQWGATFRIRRYSPAEL